MNYNIALSVMSKIEETRNREVREMFEAMLPVEEFLIGLLTDYCECTREDFIFSLSHNYVWYQNKHKLPVHVHTILSKMYDYMSIIDETFGEDFLSYSFKIFISDTDKAIEITDSWARQCFHKDIYIPLRVVGKRC